MTLTANAPGDSISILGRYGAITHESANPDKVFVDADLATLAGLEIDGDNLLKAKVDGSTIDIDGSGQLYLMNANIALDDLNDTNVPAPSDKQVLAYSGVSGEWQAQTMTLNGAPGAASADTQTVVDSITITSTTNAASKGHTHAAGPAQKETCAVGAHSHWSNEMQLETGLAAAVDRFDAMRSVNAQTSYQTIHAAVSPRWHYLAPTGHQHNIGSLAISIT